MGKAFTENDIEILISTMNQKSLDFLFPMFPSKHFSNYNILIINQSKTTTLSSEFPSVRVINTSGLGLSKSRNSAIDNAIGKILIIADDDVIYQNNFIEKIITAYNKFDKATVINFCAVKEKGVSIKKYPGVSKPQLNAFEIFNISSIEMTINKEKLDSVGIRFDENFGLGSSFELGEEAVFLFDLKDKNEQIAFENQVIVKHEGLTSSNKIDSLRKYYIYGAILRRILITNYPFWLMTKLFFDIKQKRLKISSFFKAIYNANKGRKAIEVMNYGR
ncbi:glycosyltransferase family 2 protein [Flavobacterium sp. RS13.1]|uniref:glycosyltransferase family 2 protein n=1 Tax=Flavobacterium sp. RS13.1 TaxID=3400345 RepID=UPI003AAC0975